jgi:hypothetical protein
MIKDNSHPVKSTTPPPQLLPVLEKLKSGYIVWIQLYQVLPKHHRHTLGQKIDQLLIETTEAVAQASFLSKGEKSPYVRIAIRKMDTVKVLLLILWESKSIDGKKYISISLPFDEVGRMLGGWHG